MIVNQSQLNTAALIVPDLYVVVVPPQTYLLTGVPTNIVGVVGTATWGPVNQPVTIGDMPTQIISFGTPVNRKYDLGTQVATAILQGGNNFRCVRVTDGTDIAATSTGVTGSITFTAKYTGTSGNKLTITLSTGSKAGSWKALVGVPGSQAELFDNIVGTGAAFWTNFANAINLGNNALRGPSQLVVATAASGSTAPQAATYTFSGGTDGTSALTSTNIVGLDDTTRSGIYALRGQGCGLVVPADLDDSTQWTLVDQMANQEAAYSIVTGPSGDTITNAISTKQTAGLDSYNTKVMFGDWIIWNDQFNGIKRLVSPQGFAAGRLANLSPEQSSLNKPLFGIVGTQRSNATVATYSNAELTQLTQAGIEVITNPGAGGLSIWTCRIGHNSSSNAAISGDNYTRLTNFIATSLNSGMGLYLGKPINAELARNVKATLDSFFLGMLGQGILANDVDDGGVPYSVIVGIGPNTNNPPERTKLGIFQADCQCQYQSINEKFVLNIEGGQTVTITRQTLQNGQLIV